MVAEVMPLIYVQMFQFETLRKWHEYGPFPDSRVEPSSGGVFAVARLAPGSVRVSAQNSRPSFRIDARVLLGRGGGEAASWTRGVEDSRASCLAQPRGCRVAGCRREKRV